MHEGLLREYLTSAGTLKVPLKRKKEKKKEAMVA